MEEFSNLLLVIKLFSNVVVVLKLVAKMALNNILHKKGFSALYKYIINLFLVFFVMVILLDDVCFTFVRGRCTCRYYSHGNKKNIIKVLY